MPFRSPFYKEPTSQEPKKGSLKAKILFFVILALLIYCIIVGIIGK